MQRILMSLVLVLIPVLALAALDKPLKQGAKIAFLGMTFIDTSTEGAYDGARADQTARTRMLEETTRQRLRDEGFVVLDNQPISDELSNTTNPAHCYGCEVRMAERLGADYVLVGEVQKVSNLILSMNLVLRDVKSGEAVRALAVDIRSNTDQSWLRGLNYIFKNHFFKS
ncbi:MAG: DUF3280 domain-containing protein [Alphaproteobacteria bacterium]|nr:DUF2380 domain-containing protein [Rhizobiaceae bacterium]MBU3960280.1 DUF3280 domain-containing protein [Alphaproteobacteria bacterium]MBU4048609.1 DUF3280 domain-containing protein [Alphaproteobacteria bacterium]MBU4088938.1 DUF3280 domain-containing protein [Alphaproteobacteria bacterium]MBU4157898.1 DUF3280 domain-containing protein [Alphaproteobacteria bacterium]